MDTDPLLQVETTCVTLLCELRVIWDEVGEPEEERDKMLLELETECRQVYRRKVDQASKHRAQLRQTMADYEAELASICSAMGERPVRTRQSDHNAGSLKEELKAILPQLEEMHKQKVDRKRQFIEVLRQSQEISSELNASAKCIPSSVIVDESDSSLRKLEELCQQLQVLQLEKSNRLQQVQEHLSTLNTLCLVLGLDFDITVSEVPFYMSNPGGGGEISSSTIERIALKILNLREIKLPRMLRLQELATRMLGLWNLMDTSAERSRHFSVSPTM